MVPKRQQPGEPDRGGELKCGSQHERQSLMHKVRAIAGPLQRDKRPKVPDHLRWIKTLPCIACGLPDHSDPHHIKPACVWLGKRQSGTHKPDDCWVIPLCRQCHDNAHDNEIGFWNHLYETRFNVENEPSMGVTIVNLAPGIKFACTIALALWAATGDDFRGNQIVKGASNVDG